LRFVVLAGLAAAGCSFEHGALGPSDGQATPDTPRMIDGGRDAEPIDAACPDDDVDGVCNDDDDWPCGAKPTAPPTTVTFMNNNGATVTTLSLVTYNGMGNLAVGPASTFLAFTARLQITDTACSSNCVDQIEAGWVDPATNMGNRFSQCLFDATVNKNNGLDTTLAADIRTPATGNVYDLRVNLGQNNFCGDNGNNGWWPNNTVPASTKTIAKLCVH
jgi:hypothetical protein